MLRCRLFPPKALRPMATRCAENLAMIGRDQRPLGRLWGIADGSVHVLCRRRQADHFPREGRGNQGGAIDASMSWCVTGDDGRGSHEESPQRMLEGGDRTVGVGESGLEMGEDLRRWPARGFGRQRGRQLRWRAPLRQCRADLALAQVEALPEALPGPVAEMAIGGANGSEDAVGDGALEEAPQTAGGQAEPSDFVGAPDAESPTATATCLAVAAKNPPRADRLSLGMALLIAAQKAVANQRADHLAVRTRHLLKSLRHRAPFLGAADKPTHLAHARPVTSTTSLILPPRRGAG
jgi:hypothetical protein